jgi:hypothetical protein
MVKALIAGLVAAAALAVAPQVSPTHRFPVRRVAGS